MSHYLTNLFESRLFTPIIRKVRKQGLTYLPTNRLVSIAKLTRQAIKRTENPLLLEFGVALGGSSIVMTDLLTKSASGKLFGYDMFGLIPPPSDVDGLDAHQRYQEIVDGKSVGLKGGIYYGYQTDLRQKVVQSFEDYNFRHGDQYTLIAGDFRETFQTPDREISFIHIDCDWHDSVVFCLEVAKKHLEIGGHVAVDDYNDYDGCKNAVDEFIKNNSDCFVLSGTSPHAILLRYA